LFIFFLLSFYPRRDRSTKIEQLLKIKNTEKHNTVFYGWTNRFYDYLVKYETKIDFVIYNYVVKFVGGVVVY